MTDTMTVKRGKDYSFLLTLSDANGIIDLTNKVVFFTVKDVNSLNPANDTNAVITKTITVHSDPTH